MISADLRFEGFDVRSWTNLVGLFLPDVHDRLSRVASRTDAPRADARRPVERAAGTVIIVVDETRRVLAAQHTLRGRIVELAGERIAEHTAPEAPPVLARYAASYGAQRVVLLREGAMEELAERLALRYRAGTGYVAHLLDFVRSARELMATKLIETWPPPPSQVPIPPAATVERAFDLVLPDNHAAVLVLWASPREREQNSPLFTAAVLRRRHGEIDLVAGPDLLTRWSGPLGGDWRRDFRVVLDAVRRTVAPVHVGAFTDVETFRRLLVSTDPAAWAREIALRNVLVTPMPTSAKVAIGAGAVRGLGQASAKLIGGIDLPGTLMPILDTVRNELTTVRTLTETLGFDPLRVLAAFLQAHDLEFDDARPLPGEANHEHLSLIPHSSRPPVEPTAGEDDPSARD